MRKTQIVSIAIASLVLIAGCLPAVAQDQIVFGDSFPTFDFVGTGTSTINLRLKFQTFSFNSGLITCSAGSNWFFGAGSASGSGSLGSGGTINCDGSANLVSGYGFTSSAQIPASLTSQGNGSFTVSQTTPINFVYKSDGSFGIAAGTILLSGNLNLASVTMGSCPAVNNCSATAIGTLTSLSGKFAGNFSTGQGLVTFTLALGGNLQTLTSAQVASGTAITSQILSGSTLAPMCDFLTGGGWIPNTGATGPGSAPGAGNGKATFAIAGGIKHCNPWGHLNYIDHGTGLHAHADQKDMTGYDRRTATCSVVKSSSGATLQPNSNTRHITGTATLNDGSTTPFDVCATDNGEPGINDVFEVRLGTGYHNAGQLGGGVQGGGNILLHKGNPSFCCGCTTSPCH